MQDVGRTCRNKLLKKIVMWS